jgi:alpha-tubulin suppressor-like RCC1 family protein
MACGLNNIIAEAEEGIWVLGNNSEGQLGLGHTTDALQPTLVHVKEHSERPVRCLVALYNGMIVIDSQGGVFSAGDNSSGELGRSPGDDPSQLQRISNIPPMLTASCGFYHTLTMDENGEVWSWGFGGSGQLGTGTYSVQRRPILVPLLKGMSDLVAGRSHSLAFPQEGGLLVFGNNSSGQLGLNHTTNQPTPALCPIQPALPYTFTCSRKKSARSLPHHERRLL